MANVGGIFKELMRFVRFVGTECKPSISVIEDEALIASRLTEILKNLRNL